MTRHTINIVNTQQHGYRTLPGTLEVEVGDEVTWINNAQEVAQLKFANGGELFAPNPDNERITGPSTAHQVLKGALRGKHQYQVLLENNKYADGNSDPQIVVL